MTSSAASSTGRKRRSVLMPGRLERDDLEVAGQAAAGQQHGHQQGHRQRVGEERRQHEHEQLHHEVERHALGDDEVGEVVDAIDDEEEREEGAAEAERRDELADDVAVEDRHRWRPSRVCCTIAAWRANRAGAASSPSPSSLARRPAALAAGRAPTASTASATSPPAVSASPQLVDAEPPAEAYREIYALLDEEIVESLASGGVFASLEFLQDRLDAFGEAWGGATSALIARSAGCSSAPSSSATARPATACASTAAARRGGAADHDVPRGPPRACTRCRAAADGAQFLVAWEGAPSGRGTRPLRVELVRAHGGRRARRVVHGAACFPTDSARARTRARRRPARPLRAALPRLDAGLRRTDRAGGRLPARAPARRSSRASAARSTTPGIATCTSP